MLTVQQALDRVRQNTQQLPSAQRSLRDCLGLVLAEDVVSDLDSPPFDKSMRDGFAVRCADLQGPGGRLSVVGEVMAGQTSSVRLQAGQALRIMTGAPIPAGADAVVMFEESTLDGDHLTVAFAPPANAFIMAQGRELRRDEVVLSVGQRLHVAQLGLLATVGRPEPLVVRPPKVAIITSGDEIVPASQKPGPGQIRNSNAPTLVSLVQSAGAELSTIRHCFDDLEDITKAVKEGLQSDFLLLAGGVSAGDRDFVPAALAACGVQEVFHKVKLKPGKPLWFGRTPGCSVFGLPGNPVSVIACFEIFVRRALAWAQGSEASGWTEARLVKDYEHTGDRAVLHPARLGPAGVELQAWFGSPDLRAVAGSNAFVLLPTGPVTITPDDALPVLRFGA